MKNEVLVQKTHRVGYDHAIRNAGVKMIEVETREELEKAINERTAMMFFLNFADPQGKIHHEEFVAIGKKHNVPTLDRRGRRRPAGGEPLAVHEAGLRPGRLLRRQGPARAAVGGPAAGPQGPDRGRQAQQQPQRRHPLPDQQGQQGGDHRHAGGPRDLTSRRTTPRSGRTGRRAAARSPRPWRRSPTSRPRSTCPRSPTRCRTCAMTWDYQGARPDRRRRWSRSSARASPSIEVAPGSVSSSVDRRLDDGARRRRDRRRRAILPAILAHGHRDRSSRHARIWT